MSTPALVNANTLNELGEVIGRERLDRLIDRFVVALSGAFAGEGRPEAEIGREAHTLVSMAGMLGCDALCGACRDLEYRAKRGEDIAASLADARRLRDGTRDALSSRQG